MKFEVLMTLIKLSSVLFMSALIFSCKPKPLTSGLKSDSDSSSKHLVFRTDAYVDDSYQFTVEIGPFPADMLANNQISLMGDLDLCKPGTQVDDVARAVLFLASEYDGFITGATLDINGGVYNM